MIYVEMVGDGKLLAELTTIPRFKQSPRLPSTRYSDVIAIYDTAIQNGDLGGIDIH